MTTLPSVLQQQLRDLSTGRFASNAINVLAFGLPGTGKSHACCAIGH
ncbi:MAG: DNA replication protein DnaC, partial [Myxococcota bacterium]